MKNPGGKGASLLTRPKSLQQARERSFKGALVTSHQPRTQCTLKSKLAIDLAITFSWI